MINRSGCSLRRISAWPAYLQQIAQAGAQRHGRHLQRLAATLDGDLGALLGRVFGHGLDQRLDVAEDGPLLAVLFAQVPQGAIEQLDHVVHVLADPGVQARIVDVLDAQLHPRQGRAQVMGDGREHAPALLELFEQVLVHAIERPCGLAGLPRPGDGNGRTVEVVTQVLGGLGQLAQRPGQQPRPEPGGDHQRAQLEDQRAAEKPLDVPPYAGFPVRERPGRRWPIEAGLALHGRRRGRRSLAKAMPKPEKGQQMAQQDGQQKDPEQAGEQGIQAAHG